MRSGGKKQTVTPETPGAATGKNKYYDSFFCRSDRNFCRSTCWERGLHLFFRTWRLRVLSPVCCSRAACHLRTAPRRPFVSRRGKRTAVQLFFSVY